MRDDQGFELELRQLIDQHFDREPPADHPIQRLIRGELPIEECRALYSGMWESVCVFNQVHLPRLLEKAPRLSVRAELMYVLSQEFGAGKVRAAHPYLFYRFLIALGVPEARLVWDNGLDRGPVRDEVLFFRSLTWPQLLARIICGESLGPVAFSAVSKALQRSYNMSDSSLDYFMIHNTVDQKDMQILLGLARKTVTSDRDRYDVLDIVRTSYSTVGHRYGLYSWCLEGTAGYRYVPLFNPN